MAKRKPPPQPLPEAASFPFGYVHRAQRPPPPPEVDYLTTPPYPLRAQESFASSPLVLGGGFVQWPTERLFVFGDVVGGALAQVYFPVEYAWRREDGEEWEGLSVVGDVIGGQLGAVYVPFGYTWRRDNGEPWEGLSVYGDVVGGQLGAVYFPIDYPNWPPEGLSVLGDVVGGSLTTP